MSTAPRWFPARRTTTEAEAQVFCLPHSGAGASAYRSWGPRLAPAVEVVPVQLAGRELRFSEPPARSAGEIVEGLVEPMARRAVGRFALFGHSMGALLAFELAHALAARDRLPAALIVSGYGAPHVRAPHRSSVDVMDDDQLADEIQRLQGTDLPPAEFAAVFTVLAPVFRADFGICDRYRYEPHPPLPVPIVVLTGRDDRTVTRAEVDAWRDLGTAGVAIHDFPGDHFFLRPNIDEVLRIVEKTVV